MDAELAAVLGISCCYVPLLAACHVFMVTAILWSRAAQRRAARESGAPDHAEWGPRPWTLTPALAPTRERLVSACHNLSINAWREMDERDVRDVRDLANAVLDEEMDRLLTAEGAGPKP